MAGTAASAQWEETGSSLGGLPLVCVAFCKINALSSGGSIFCFFPLGGPSPSRGLRWAAPGVWLRPRCAAGLPRNPGGWHVLHPLRAARICVSRRESARGGLAAFSSEEICLVRVVG